MGVSLMACEHSRFTCTDCLTPRERVAFGEKVRSCTLKFTYGKENFHGPTIGEQMEDNKRHWEREGLTGENAPVPAHDKYRWV
jgi:hypothetical protein